MKLATLKDSTRDGKLVVVSKDLTKCSEVGHIARTLQAALDDWEHVAPRLERVAEGIETGSQPTMRFHEHDAHSPLPARLSMGGRFGLCQSRGTGAQGAQCGNAGEFLDRSADVSGRLGHVSWRRAIRSAFPMGRCKAGASTWKARVAVIVDDVPMGATPQEAAKAIRLIMLVNDVSLRGLIPAELGKGFGFFQSKPSSAFSPVAVTPDELGDKWDGGKVHLPLLVDYNGKAFGKANAGVDMTFDFGQLVAHAAKTRNLGAGAIIGSGTVSNKDADGSPGKPVSEGGLGYSCIAEIRMIETINNGKPSTAFMKFGDTVRIEMKDDEGHSIFGAIEQKVEKA